MSSSTESATFPVHLYIYDMSKGMAKTISQSLLGFQIPGLWHTAIVVHGREYFFGGMGIQHCPPMTTMLGEPDETKLLGRTEITKPLFEDYLQSLADDTYHASKYDIFKQNCNNFSNELALFLTGKEIPPHILSLPDDILNSPIGSFIRTFMSRVAVNPGGSNAHTFEGRGQQQSSKQNGTNTHQEPGLD